MHCSERFAICGDAVYPDEAWFHCAVMEISTRYSSLSVALAGSVFFRVGGFFVCCQEMAAARHVVRPEVLLLRFD
jgi:hypothetical protein